MSAHAAPGILVFAVGNPSRGDDALGPELLRLLEADLSSEVREGTVELLTDFQLQVEHALDLRGRARVFFVDASVSVAAPYSLEPVTASRDPSFSSHAMSPAALLHAHAEALGPPPPAVVLAIRGERFELGAPLSAEAAANLDAARERLLREVRALAGALPSGGSGH